MSGFNKFSITIIFISGVVFMVARLFIFSSDGIFLVFGIFITIIAAATVAAHEAKRKKQKNRANNNENISRRGVKGTRFFISDDIPESVFSIFNSESGVTPVSYPYKKQRKTQKKQRKVIKYFDRNKASAYCHSRTKHNKSFVPSVNNKVL